MSGSPTTGRRFSFSPASEVSVFGVCAYLAGFGVPFPWDIPLTILALCGLVAVVTDPGRGRFLRAPAVFSMLFLLISIVVSTLVSVDVERSVSFSAPLLPGTLIFVLITVYFETVRHVTALLVTLSAVALGLGSLLLWTAWDVGWLSAHRHVRLAGSPLLVEANDVVLLAILSPFSFARLCLTRGLTRGLAALSMIAAACAACVLQSRVATLTMMAALISAALLVRARLAVVCGVTLVLIVLVVDASLNFPLLAKFGHSWDSRYSRVTLWIAAWSMFLDAPWLGHGPHTFRLLYPTYVSAAGETTAGIGSVPVIPWAHNLYVETLSGQGILGLTALSTMLGLAIASARQTRPARSREVQIFGAAVFSALVAFGFAAVLELTFSRKWVVVTLFMLAGLSARLARLTERDN